MSSRGAAEAGGQEEKYNHGNKEGGRRAEALAHPSGVAGKANGGLSSATVKRRACGKQP